MYAVVSCYGCRRLFVADASKKSRRCPYCGIKVWLAKVKQIGQVETAREAVELVQFLKRNKK